MKDKVSIAKVDCTENPKVQEEQGVRGYPTLKLFVDGTPVEFEGDRSLDGLQKWVTKMTVAPTTKVACELFYVPLCFPLVSRCSTLITQLISLRLERTGSQQGGAGEFPI